MTIPYRRKHLNKLHFGTISNFKHKLHSRINLQKDHQSNFISYAVNVI